MNKFKTRPTRRVVLAAVAITAMTFLMVGLSLTGSVASAASTHPFTVRNSPIDARRQPTPTPGPTPPPGVPWLLENYNQSDCFDTIVTSSFYGIWISGKWTQPIKIGIKNLPSGGTFTTSYAPIAPGSSDGIGSLAYVEPKIPSTTPVGVYTAMLVATDGTRTEMVPVKLNVVASCGY